MLLARFAVILFSAVAQTTAQPATSQSPDALQAGMRALDAKDYVRAEQVFSSVSASDPKDYAALFYLALAETGLNKNSEAISDYGRVLQLRPGLYEAELNLGILELRENQPGRALEILEQAAKQKPANARVQRYLGDARLRNRDLSGAITAYQTALAADPKMGAAELGLGQALIADGKVTDAVPHYRQAATLDSGLKSYLLEVAQALSQAGHTDEAISLLREFPDDPGAREELGRVYLETKQPSQAVAEFEAAVRLSPTPANQLALATAYLQNNQQNQAAPILERALASNPNDYDLHMAVGRIYRDRRQFAQAAQQFLSAAELRPSSVPAWNEAVNPLVMAGQYDQALSALDKIRSLNAETPGDLYYRAMIFDQLHQIKPALAAYQKFLSQSQGQYPDQEFVARQRSRILERETNR
jgi:tetratricopeptide (TPR) repeat protein